MDFEEQVIGKKIKKKSWKIKEKLICDFKLTFAPLWRACTAYAFTKIGSFDV